jgi:hypothetical protein
VWGAASEGRYAPAVYLAEQQPTGKVALLPLQAVLLQATGQFRNIGYWYVGLHTKEGDIEK